MERRKERRARERAIRKKQSREQNQGRNEFPRSKFLRNALIGTAGLAGAVILSKQVFEDDAPVIQADSDVTKRVLEVPESVFKAQAAKALDNFERIYGLGLNKQDLLDHLDYVDLTNMTPAARDELCSRVVCTNAEGYTGGSLNRNHEEERMYIFKDKIDLYFQNTARENPDVASLNPQIISESVNTRIRNDVVHEVIHFSGRRRYPVSPQLDEMIRKHIGANLPQLANTEEYQPADVVGFRITYLRTIGPGGATIFHGLEEAIAINGAENVARNSTPDQRYYEPDRTYFYNQAQMFSELLSKMPSTSLKSVLALRLNPGSLDGLIKLVGERFESDPEKQYEKGFQILHAISDNKRDLYTQYTSK